MSVNLSELNQNMLRVIENADEQGDFLQKFLGGSATNVTFNNVDANGHPISRSIPNLAKFTASVKNTIASELYQVVYIDAINGDDNNSGSSSSPRKTILGCFRNTPLSGGLVKIVFLSDVQMDADITRLNSSVILSMGDFKLYLVNRTGEFMSDGVTPATSGQMFRFRGSLKLIIEANSSAVDNLIMPNKIDDLPSNQVYGALISPYFSFRNGGRSSLHLQRIRVAYNGYGALLNVGPGDCSFTKYGSVLVDNTNTGVEMKDTATGVVKDATTGLPLNCQSNFVL